LRLGERVRLLQVGSTAWTYDNGVIVDSYVHADGDQMVTVVLDRYSAHVCCESGTLVRIDYGDPRATLAIRETGCQRLPHPMYAIDLEGASGEVLALARDCGPTMLAMAYELRRASRALPETTAGSERPPRAYQSPPSAFGH
jgi:hypothetical protein